MKRNWKLINSIVKTIAESDKDIFGVNDFKSAEVSEEEVKYTLKLMLDAENKYLGLQYRQNGNTHTETVCFLSSDITVLLKRNSFVKLNICDIHGNTKDTYALKRR